MINNREKVNYRIMTAALIAFMAVSWALFIFLNGFVCLDAMGHSAIVGYTLRGYDAYKLIGEEALLPEVGAIPPYFSTVPWALAFGAIFYPGYLPFKFVKIYITALHFIVLALMMLTVAKKTKNSSAKSLTMFLFAVLGNFSFMYSLHFGNCGGVVSMLVVCAVLLVDDKPALAGLIMGVALLKPQISAVFCLLWLIEKKIKPLVVAGLFTVAGWAASSLCSHTDPLTLLKEMLGASTASELQYLGLLSPLRFAGVSSTVILAANMIIGCAFAVILYMQLKKRGLTEQSLFLRCLPAACASCVWIYKNGTDYLMLIVAVFALLEMLSLITDGKRFFALMVMTVYVQLSRAAVSFVSYAFPDSPLLRDLAKSADGFLILAVGVGVCALASSVYKKKIAE